MPFNDSSPEAMRQAVIAARPKSVDRATQKAHIQYWTGYYMAWRAIYSSSNFNRPLFNFARWYNEQHGKR